MTYFLVAAVASFMLATRGGRRVGNRTLGATFVAIAMSIGLAGVALDALEPNLGPLVLAACIALVAVSLAVLAAGALRVEALGRWLRRPRTRRVLRRAGFVGTSILFALATTATVKARSSAQPGPDLEPLVTAAGACVDLASGGLAVKSGTKKVDPTRYWDDTCIVTLADTDTAQQHEVVTGAADVMSGSVLCPNVEVTIDPSRRIIYLGQRGWFGVPSHEAWRMPGFTRTMAIVWRSRLAPLHAAPGEWIGAAWAGVVIAVGMIILALRGGRHTRRRFRDAVEGEHLGDAAVLLAGDAAATRIAAAADFAVGPITILNGAQLRTEGYREARAMVGGDIVPSTLAELTDPHERREAFGYVLALLALSLGAAPLVVASFAGLLW